MQVAEVPYRLGYQPGPAAATLENMCAYVVAKASAALPSSPPFQQVACRVKLTHLNLHLNLQFWEAPAQQAV